MKYYLDNIKKLLFITNKRLINLLLLVFIFIFASLLELISLGLIYPYVNLVIEPNTAINSKPISYLSPLLHEKEFKNYFIYSSSILIFIFFMKTIMSIYLKWFISKFSEEHLSYLSVRLMAAYQRMNYNDYLKRDKSEYLRNLKIFTYNCLDGIKALLRIFSETLIVLVIAIYLSLLNFYALFTFVIFISFTYFIYNSILRKKLIEYGKHKNDGEAVVFQNVTDGIRGFKEIRVLSKESFFKDLIQSGAEKICKFQIKTNLIIFSPRHIFELFVVLFVVFFLSISVFLGSELNLLLPTIAVFAVAGLRLVPACSDIMAQMSYLNYANDGINVIFNDLKKYESLKNTNELNTKKGNSEKFMSMELKNLNFKYSNSSSNVFENLNFSIKRNECIGIIGESGSGKTTLIDILLGLLQPQSGKILINNKETKNTFLDWQNKVAYLPQDDLILDQSIRTNISLENNLDKQNLKKINDSLKKANLDKHIESLPNSFNTKIGKNGTRLSVGQNKRVALARTFYHDKEVLIMDEATSSLDVKTEDNIVEQINLLKKDRTIIIITHRLSTLKNCDCIYKISNKNIAKES